MRAAQRRYNARPDVKARKAAQRREHYWADPDYRERVRERMRKPRTERPCAEPGCTAVLRGTRAQRCPTHREERQRAWQRRAMAAYRARRAE